MGISMLKKVVLAGALAGLWFAMSEDAGAQSGIPTITTIAIKLRNRLGLSDPVIVTIPSVEQPH